MILECFSDNKMCGYVPVWQNKYVGFKNLRWKESRKRKIVYERLWAAFLCLH